ncbi:MAG: LacI family DNA-binding transcriptional regulator [Chitinophagaceae bacterium]
MHTIAQILTNRVTIHDIARELNLTAATVSRALNNNPRISTETTQLVQDKADQLRYRRDKLASSLRSGQSHTIGVIIPSAQINFFGSVVHGIETTASENGYSIILYQSEEKTAIEKKAIDTFLSARVDGILASIAKETVNFSHYAELKKRNVPLVFFDRINDDIETPSVMIDDYKGAFIATEHLIKKGYKNIGHVSGPLHIKTFSARLNGYKEALRANGIDFDEAFVYQGDVSIESGKKAADYYLSLESPPDAAFAVEDFTALGLIKGLKEHKIKIPDEFGVVGFANESFDEHITPSLSSIDQQTVEMGKEAFNLLKSLIKTRNCNVMLDHNHIVLEPILLCRESSAGKK